MSQILPIQLPSGDTVWARVETAPGPRDMANTGVAAALKAEGFPETIKAVAESVRMGLRDIKPNEVRVEFGVELTVKSGKVLSVLAEVGGTASVKVELTWIGDDSQASPE